MASRVAIVLSHPTQYYSPWFRVLAQSADLDIRVFYLWNFGVTQQVDKVFGQSLQWDLPLLEGYDSEFVPNIAKDPGTHHFRGLQNPELPARIGAWNPDAVLVFGHGWETMSRLLARGSSGHRLLYRGDSHLLGPGTQSLKQRFKRMVTARLLNRCDHFLAVGQRNTEYFRAHGIPDSRISFVPHCIDNDRFRTHATPERGAALRRSLSIPENHQVVLFAGKLEEKKRPLDLVQAFLRLNRTDATLLIVGSGPLERAVHQAAEGASNVKFLPFQNQTSMPAVYAAADVYVLPSYGRFETWGLAVNEAMNCGCAIVVSDHVGCAVDLVRDGVNGRVFAAGNGPALEAALRDALADRVRLEQWKKASLQIVTGYSYDGARESLIAVLNKTSSGVRQHEAVLR